MKIYAPVINTILKTTGLFLLTLLYAVNSAASPNNTAPIQFKVVPGPAEQFGANAVILYGQEEAVLIDTAFTISAAENLAKEVKSLNRKLTGIYLTHGHPDHAAAANSVLEFFPDVKIYASSGVRGELERDFYAKLVRWQDSFPGNLSTTFPPIHLLDGKLFLEGQEIQWRNVVGGESWDATVYYVPSIKTLITGDLIFNKMHLYNADVYRPDMWIKILESLGPTFGEIQTVIPGHGEVGDASIIESNRAYLEEFISVATLPFPDLAKVHDHMVKKYPDWAWPMILHMTRGPAVTNPALLELYRAKTPAKTANQAKPQQL